MFVLGADLNFQYSAALGKRQPARRLPGCLADALSQCYMTYTASREIVAHHGVHGPVVICLCAHSTRMAHPQEVEDVFSAADGLLTSARAYTDDSSLSGRFSRPHAFGSDSSLQEYLHSFCRA